MEQQVDVQTIRFRSISNRGSNFITKLYVRRIGRGLLRGHNVDLFRSKMYSMKLSSLTLSSSGIENKILLQKKGESCPSPFFYAFSIDYCLIKQLPADLLFTGTQFNQGSSFGKRCYVIQGNRI